MNNQLKIVVLAAGKGSRMISSLPKIFHKIAEKPIVHYVLDACLSLPFEQDVVLVLSPDMDKKKAVGNRPVTVAYQKNPLGTGDAVKSAVDCIKDPLEQTDVLVLCGDAPLVRGETLHQIVKLWKSANWDGLIVGMRPKDKAQYGRIVVNNVGHVCKIVEFADADDEEKEISLCNSGVILLKGGLLKQYLPRLEPKNEQGEFYFTDIVKLACDDGKKIGLFEGPAEEFLGINNRLQLAQASDCLQDRWRAIHMARGVTFINPSSVFLCHDTLLGSDVIIEPNVTFGPGVQIEKNAIIRSFSVIENSHIKEGVVIGPFAHIRANSVIDKNAVVGNFVEVKNSVVGLESKIKHLSYIGDTHMGHSVNVGAGTITCNYNGVVKTKTIIEDRAFIGSNTSLIAPVRVGSGATVAAGSVITQDVPDDGLGIARPQQVNKKEWSLRFRKKYSSFNIQ